MQILGRLSDSIAIIEENRASLPGSEQRLDQLRQIVHDIDQQVADRHLGEAPIPEEYQGVAEAFAAAQGVMPAGAINALSVADLQMAIHRGYDQAQQRHKELAEMLRSAEAQLRDTLQLIANATAG